MNLIPTKEQIDKLASDVKQYQDNINKADCEYMYNLICETFTQALKSNSSKLYAHTDIDKNAMNNWANMRMENCRFGPGNEPIEQILKSAGVKLHVTSSTSRPMMSYNKLDKILIICPK